MNCFSKNAASESNSAIFIEGPNILGQKGENFLLRIICHTCVCRKLTPPVVCLHFLFLDYSYTGFPSCDWLRFKYLKSSSEQTTVHLLFIDDFFKLLAALNSDFLSIYFPISGSCLTNQDKQ